MQNIINNIFRLSGALFTLTFTAIICLLFMTICLMITSAVILPAVAEASNHLAHINWYGLHKLFQEVLKYTALAVGFICMVVYFLNHGKKSTNKPSVG